MKIKIMFKIVEEKIMKLNDLSDKELATIANNIKTENKRRANRKAAAMAILAILKNINYQSVIYPNWDSKSDLRQLGVIDQVLSWQEPPS